MTCKNSCAKTCNVGDEVKLSNEREFALSVLQEQNSKLTNQMLESVEMLLNIGESRENVKNIRKRDILPTIRRKSACQSSGKSNVDCAMLNTSLSPNLSIFQK